MACGRPGIALERLLGDLHRVLRNLGEALGVMLAPKMAAEVKIYRTKCGSKRQAVPQRCFDRVCVEDQQLGETLKSVLESTNPNVKCILFQHRHRILFVLGANTAPC